MKKLTITELKKIGSKAGLTKQKSEVFAKFFDKRFSKEPTSPAYASEWAYRFHIGTEWLLSDWESRRILLQVNNKKYKNMPDNGYGLTKR